MFCTLTVMQGRSTHFILRWRITCVKYIKKKRSISANLPSNISSYFLPGSKVCTVYSVHRTNIPMCLRLIFRDKTCRNSTTQFPYLRTFYTFCTLDGCTCSDVTSILVHTRRLNFCKNYSIPRGPSIGIVCNTSSNN